jgi:glutamate racemase
VIVNACTHFPLLADELAAATEGRVLRRWRTRESRGESRI